MIHHHPLAPTTQTTEIQQLAAINRRLTRPDRAEITAEVLGVAGATTITARAFPLDGLGSIRPAPAPLAGACVLLRLTADNCPAFPRFYGHFLDPVGAERVTELHTPALRTLSERLGLRHSWGTGG